MVEHDERMRRAVTGLRASRSPTPGAEARVLAAVELQLGGPDGGGGSAAGEGGSAAAAGSTAPVTAGWIAKVVGATAGLTASGLLLVRVGVGAARAIAGGEQPVGEESAVVSVEPEASEPELAHEQPPPPLDRHDAPPLVVDAEPQLEPRGSKQPVEVESADTLAAELALIGAAKRASTPSAALEQLDQHGREFPNGTMASEREALAVVALCRLDRTREARERARSLVAQRPGMPLLDRMRRDCPALADLLRQTSP